MCVVVEATPSVLLAIQSSAVPYGVSMMLFTVAVVCAVAFVGMIVLQRFTLEEGKEDDGTSSLAIFSTWMIISMVTLMGVVSLITSATEMLDKAYTPEIYLAEQNNQGKCKND